MASLLRAMLSKIQFLKYWLSGAQYFIGWFL
jgi:hypothetical protein